MHANDIVIPVIPVTFSNEEDLPFEIKGGLRFPVRLSFVMSDDHQQIPGQNVRPGWFTSVVVVHQWTYVAFWHSTTQEMLLILLQSQHAR